ncbi:MAG: hypothetical protein SGJ11_03215 [Phycisphaerae bacterium]|nr:hypothetical protein [Phycisphaerae bacterium]
MLTPNQIEDLRDAITAGSGSRTGRTSVLCIDGPLEGIRFRVDRTPTPVDGSIGWIHRTETGRIVVSYAQSEVPGQLRFKGYEMPSDEPGREPAEVVGARLERQEA